MSPRAEEGPCAITNAMTTRAENSAPPAAPIKRSRCTRPSSRRPVRRSRLGRHRDGSIAPTHVRRACEWSADHCFARACNSTRRLLHERQQATRLAGSRRAPRCTCPRGTLRLVRTQRARAAAARDRAPIRASGRGPGCAHDLRAPRRGDCPRANARGVPAGTCRAHTACCDEVADEPDIRGAADARAVTVDASERPDDQKRARRESRNRPYVIGACSA